MVWEDIPESTKNIESKLNWEAVPTYEPQKSSSSKVVWEVLDPEVQRSITTSQSVPGSRIKPPSSLKKAEALFDAIPLESSDFKPLLNVSYAVPTASTLSQEEWRLISSTIYYLNYATGTGNQNYSIRVDYGLSNSLQLYGFYSETMSLTNLQSQVVTFDQATFGRCGEQQHVGNF